MCALCMACARIGTKADHMTLTSVYPFGKDEKGPNEQIGTPKMWE